MLYLVSKRVCLPISDPAYSVLLSFNTFKVA
jgi:hypothetical protein